MPKRRLDEDPENFAIPLPIQNFLWQQTRPFIRPKFGKLHEASGMEQREACKSFEKVLVQNIEFGLSPSLTEAIRSISRWRLVQAAFPHVMHCCAALLYRRKDRCMYQLGTPETKLLYTLHWIIVDAIEECADAEQEKGICHPPCHYLFPISAIQVFVYLFAPLGDFMKQSDFIACPRLENGLKLWEALWGFKSPTVNCFTTYVLPKRTFLRGKREGLNSAKFGDILISGAIPAPSKQPTKEQCSASVDSSDTGPTVTSPVSSGSENLPKEDVESNKPLTKEAESKKDPLFCEICLMTAVKSKASSATGVKGLLIDITGVLYESGTKHAIEGSVEAIEKLRGCKIPFKFVTNESMSTRTALVKKLQSFGFNISEEEIFCPGIATNSYIKENKLRPFLLVHPDILPEFADCDQSNPNCVVVGDAGEHFTFKNMNHAFSVLMKAESPQLITMGKGKYYKDKGELVMDLGGFTAALEYATGVTATIIGKPYCGYFYDAVKFLYLRPEKTAMIGDDMYSDICAAQKCSIKGVMVKTGKFRGRRT